MEMLTWHTKEKAPAKEEKVERRGIDRWLNADSMRTYTLNA